MTNSRMQRRNLRLPEYDYATPGTYFVTVCVQNRACVLGEVDHGEIHLSSVGEMIESHLWMAIDRYADVELDMYALLPNHVHALINIGWSVKAELSSVTGTEGRHGGLQLRIESIGGGELAEPKPTSLDRVMQWFKSATTNEYIRRVKVDSWPRFPGKLWQVNYYEHVVRDQFDLDRIRTYIVSNPGKWEDDTEYSPICRGIGP
jgi:putative transposase